MQDGRSAIYLLSDQHTVDLADALVDRIRHVEATTDGSHDAEAATLLKRLTRALRAELGVGQPG